MIDPLAGELRPTGSTRLRRGAMVADESGAIHLEVDGIRQEARWIRGYYPAANDAVVLLVTAGETGQSDNFVIGASGALPDTPAPEPPAEATVTAVPAASPTVTVSAGGSSFPAKIVDDVPEVGDRVLLSWRGSVAYAVGAVIETPAPEPPPPPAPIPVPAPPPSASQVGTLDVPAIDSATFSSAGRWDSYYGQSVMQGSWGGKTYTGSWFYGTRAQQLAGRNITGIRMWVAARKRSGGYNQAATLHLYTHTSTVRPGGDVGRNGGPYDVIVDPGFSGGWINLPLSFAATLVSGGGLSIAGEPYAGLAGRGEDPASGLLHIDWSY